MDCEYVATPVVLHSFLTFALAAVAVYTGSDMPLYAFSLFLPSIINQVLSSFLFVMSAKYS